MTTDSQLQKDVVKEVEAELGNAGIGVAAYANAGTVILSGTTTNYTDKYAAERAALRVAGVRVVSEGVCVREGHEQGDDELAKAVAHALQEDPLVPADVQATVEGGWVTLQGEVKSDRERDAALNAVRGRAGVERIYNLITIKTP